MGRIILPENLFTEDPIIEQRSRPSRRENRYEEIQRPLNGAKGMLLVKQSVAKQELTRK